MKKIPMTNYNERLDEVLADHREWMRGIRTDRLVGTSSEATKQAITSLIKELVAEAKPSYKTDTRGATQNPNNAFYHTKKAQGYNEAIEDYEQNLLKALSNNGEAE